MNFLETQLDWLLGEFPWNLLSLNLRKCNLYSSPVHCPPSILENLSILLYKRDCYTRARRPLFYSTVTRKRYLTTLATLASYVHCSMPFSSLRLDDWVVYWTQRQCRTEGFWLNFQQLETSISEHGLLVLPYLLSQRNRMAVDSETERSKLLPVLNSISLKGLWTSHHFILLCRTSSKILDDFVAIR